MEIDLKTDSRKVKPGDTFIAIRNVNRDDMIIFLKLLKTGQQKSLLKKEIMMLKLLLLKIQEHI